MTLLNTGSNKKFSAGWETIFRGPSKAKTGKPSAKKKSAPAKKPAAKKVHAKTTASRKTK